ncbi:MAG: YlbF family regulator [Anaerotignaceae bacterium]
MTIYDKARELGKEILEGDEAKIVMAAREAFEADQSAKDLVDEYTKLKTQWQQIMEDKDSDKTVLTSLGEEIVAVENQIKEKPSTMNLMKAESEFAAFVNSVFNLISSTIQGQDQQPEQGCSPSQCAGCGGGCH